MIRQILGVLCQGGVVEFHPQPREARQSEFLDTLVDCLAVFHGVLGWSFLEDDPSLLRAVSSGLAGEEQKSPSSSVSSVSSSSSSPAAASSPSKNAAVMASNASRASVYGFPEHSTEKSRNTVEETLLEQLSVAASSGFVRPGSKYTGLLVNPNLPQLLYGLSRSAVNCVAAVDGIADGGGRGGGGEEIRAEVVQIARFVNLILIQVSPIRHRRHSFPAIDISCLLVLWRIHVPSDCRMIGVFRHSFLRTVGEPDRVCLPGCPGNGIPSEVRRCPPEGFGGLPPAVDDFLGCCSSEE